jgi:hypothetical protein
MENVVEPLSARVSSVLAELLRAAPHSANKLRIAWQQVVGDRLARVSRVAELTDTTLWVVVGDERWARELRRSRKLVLSRLGDLLGYGVVSRCVFEIGSLPANEASNQTPVDDSEHHKPPPTIRPLPDPIAKAALHIEDAELRRQFERAAARHLAIAAERPPR